MERWSGNAYWSAERCSEKGSKRGAIGYDGAQGADEKRAGALSAEGKIARSAER